MLNDMYVHFSALETALLPYFLFVVYGVVALYIKGAMVLRAPCPPQPVETLFRASEVLESSVLPVNERSHNQSTPLKRVKS
jgi:hypothetical protein